MGHNGIRKLDLVSSRGSEPELEDLRAEAQTSRAGGSIVHIRIDLTRNFSPIDTIRKFETFCGPAPDSLKLQLAGLGLDHVERNQRSLAGSGAGLSHLIPSSFAT